MKLDNCLASWLQTPQGQYVTAWEQTKIDVLVADTFGYNALQIGMPQLKLLRQNRIPFQQIVDESANSDKTADESVDIRCDFRHLPFASHSVDLIVMSHVLEFHDDPHQILREIERILIPEGQLVIAGFNPLSLWGARRRLRGKANAFPWNGHYISPLRLKDWLKLLGFELERGNFGCYAPPCTQAIWFKRLRFMESAGDRWWGFAGGVYLLRAVKRVHGMRLILPSWNKYKSRRKAFPALSRKELKQHEQ